MAADLYFDGFKVGDTITSPGMTVIGSQILLSR